MLVSILVLTNAVLVNEAVSVTNEHTCTYSFCSFFLRELSLCIIKLKSSVRTFVSGYFEGDPYHS